MLKAGKSAFADYFAKRSELMNETESDDTAPLAEAMAWGPRAQLIHPATLQRVRVRARAQRLPPPSCRHRLSSAIDRPSFVTVTTPAASAR